MPRFSQRHGGIKKSYRLQRWFSGQECLMLLQRIQVPSIHTGDFQLSTYNSSPGDQSPLLPAAGTFIQTCRHTHAHANQNKHKSFLTNFIKKNVCFGKERWRRGQGTSGTGPKVASRSEKNLLLPLHFLWALGILGHSPAPHCVPSPSPDGQVIDLEIFLE